ncbi:MAG: acetyl-CoA carboxylase biotin carboxylase subunit [Candidatus Bipolaricaulota bacterium]|nr:MAG: acetyl-CoA carboxylase biotin carboxylase subunit [Candidatus Bipolaricaulota bacterium]
MTFDTVLIANRGEIALRVIEACRELSLDTVAVHSQADARLPYLALASRSLCIGPADPARSYLSVAAILSAAELSGAQAIHPGYGFLAEDSHFVEVCEEHGLTFIGPTSATMSLLGDKLAAREAVSAAGVPVLPGGRVDEESDPRELAEEIGYPLLVKPVYGGGGRGVRVVTSADGLPAAIAAARSEAVLVSGRPDLYLERALVNPRHIEVQVLADTCGGIVHLGERDCSVQRRHQKLVEEAPAPSLAEETRAAIHAAALQTAAAVGYRSAGTVEFLLADDGAFYFIEMNARIQVEHPVSEMVTGVNLIKEQIRLAAGDSEPLVQEEIEIRGHAIECRINAEDPERGFIPSCGRIALDELPTGFGVRVDACLYDGMVVSPHYDSLIAKIIAWGHDREEARIRMYTALERFRVRGVATTVRVAQQVISHPTFRAGRVGTGFVEELLDEQAASAAENGRGGGSDV